MANDPETDSPEPYARSRGQLILRDELAVERTVLANERTLLAWLRTTLALLLAGVTFLHLSQAVWFSIVGVICLVVGTAVLPIAVVRYRRLHKKLAPFRIQNPARDLDVRDGEPATHGPV